MSFDPNRYLNQSVAAVPKSGIRKFFDVAATIPGAISLATGRNAFATYPVWSDELDYWRNLFTWDAVGFHTGYNGMLEEFARVGTLGAHGFTAVMLYGWFVKLFGLSHSTIVLCNALWVSLGALLFCLLLKPKPLTCVYISVLLATYAPVVLYAFTSMTQLCQYGVLLIYLAFLLRYARNRKPGWLFLSLVSVVLMCCFRINYLLHGDGANRRRVDGDVAAYAAGAAGGMGLRRR